VSQTGAACVLGHAIAGIGYVVYSSGPGLPCSDHEAIEYQD
jgi:hypothetical protein